jgi:hypothetical protein
MGRALLAGFFCAALSGCVGNQIIKSPESLPEGASYIGCTDVQGQWNGTFTAATGEGLECLRVGDGFDDVSEIQTRNGKLVFK